ncbi:MAG: dihydrolipoyl dehydrogenase [Candidatus Micrarchaeota archaeon]
MVVGEVAVETQVVVIGGGPGGYVCAIRLAQLGKQVMLVEKDPLGMGGICLNHGCIPSKALIHVSSLADSSKHMADIGISVENIHVDMKKMQLWKTGVVTNLRKGVENLCKQNGVEVVFGEAHFESNRRIGIAGNHDVAAIEFQQAVVATGSVPIEIPSLKFNGNTIISSTEALQLDVIPKDLLVIGTGYNGIEMGTMLAKLGSKVKMLEKGPKILPGVEAEVSSIVERRLKELGVEIYLNCMAESYGEQNGKLSIKAIQEGKQIELIADKVLVVIGRKPNVESLRLMNTKAALDEKGFIKVNEKMQSLDPRIYAIGDVAGNPMLAHKAFMEGKLAAQVISGDESAFHSRAVPAVIFSDPEIAYVGLMEKEALEKGVKVKVGKFPFRALGRAATMESPIGFVKVVADFDSDVLLGVEVVGPNASDLISEASLAIEMGARLEDLALTIHPHPTLPEGLMEAAEVAMGKAIHFYSKKS